MTATDQHQQPADTGTTGGYDTNRRKTFDLPHADAAYWVDEDGVWYINGFLEARQILRGADAEQAGFLAEFVRSRSPLIRPPIFFQEGPPHHEQRRNVARYFTAKNAENHRPGMEAYADLLLDELQRQSRADLSTISMRMAVHVAAEIIGLTESRIDGMDRRIDRMLSLNVEAYHPTPANIFKLLKGQSGLFAFNLLDVKPAIKARRVAPQDDLISHLLAQDYSDAEILVECITFGVAGMVTTREFIAIAALHCLENPDLRERLLTTEGQKERYDLLYEILRLEPPFGYLRRRATADIVLESGSEQVTIPAGALIHISIYAVNAEQSIVGEHPDVARPDRTMTKLKPRVQTWAMTFGEGDHHCPGQPIAIQETDIFLRKLLALPNLRIEQPPTITRNVFSHGYEVRNFIVALD